MGSAKPLLYVCLLLSLLALPPTARGENQPALAAGPSPSVPTSPSEPTRPTSASKDSGSLVTNPSATEGAASASPLSGGGMQLPDLTKRETFSSALQIILLLTVLSLAPAILIMMTSFTRMIIVLSLLRQALGTQQLPPNQILIGLALFMTFLVMRPTWQQVNDQALRPYLDGNISQEAALNNAVVPVRQFMIRQIRKNGNDEDVFLFAGFAHEKISSWHDVSTLTLIPAFMLSELKTAFLLGFKIYLPFLVIDMVISTILISMGMMMLPPTLISMPFKLLLFVLVDGWRLITAGLMVSFVT